MFSQDYPLKIFNASAGSGKTFTLVQAYFKLVLGQPDPLKFRSILAMTFTNKAANEMKERILTDMIRLAKDNHLKTEEDLIFLDQTAKNIKIPKSLIESRAKAVLNKILHNYSSFSVMTIDKFTHKIIRTFAKDLGISIDFNVEMDIVGFRQTITDLLMEQIGRNKSLTSLILKYANDNLDDEKTWTIKDSVFEFTNLLLKEDAIEAVKHLENLTDQDFIEIHEDLKKTNAIIKQNMTSTAQEAVDLIKSKGFTHIDFAGKSKGVYAFFQRVLKNEISKITAPSNTLINNSEADVWGHKQSPNFDAVQNIGDLLKKYLFQLQSIINNELPQYSLNKSILNNLNNLALLKYILKLIEQVKSDENILLLSDFYKKIAEIITKENVPFIYERLGIKYQHFLLDEFQDTSQMQWVNLIPLVHNSLAQKHENLIVGDGKQAIYRWRNGEVEQFTKLPETIHNPNQIPSLSEAENLFKAMGKKNNLDYNYRSAIEIVTFNNMFFGELAEKLNDKLNYIYKGHKQGIKKKHTGYIEGFFKPDFDNDEQLEYISKTIKKSIKAGFNLNDICIIIRNNKEGSLIANFLTQQHYPVISPDSLFIGKDTTVKFLFYLMQSLTNLNDKNAIIKTIEHYSKLKNKPAPNYIIERSAQLKSIKNYFKDEDNIELKSPEQFHNLYDYTEYLIEIFDFDPTNNVYLQFFMENIHQFEINKNVNIRDFLTWFKEKGNKKSIISPQGANAIQIMTIHKSKGLQFPVVICPFYDWTPKLDRQISWVIQPDKKLPAYFLNMKKDLAKTELSDLFLVEEAKFELDQFNLLYVAFTRPETALFISGKNKSGLAKNYIEPIFKSLPNFNLINSIYSYGELICSNKKETKNNLINIEFVKQKMNKPELSYKSAMDWELDSLDQKRNFGILVHYILSKIESLSDIDVKIKAISIKQGLTETEQLAIKQYITTLFENQHFAGYFNCESWNEKELINTQGQKLIPDKIIFKQNQVKVVDFKTGQPSPSHNKQITNYIKLLKDIGYNNVSGELCYTETLDFIEVNN